MADEKDPYSFNCPGCETKLILVTKAKIVKLDPDDPKNEVVKQEDCLLSPESDCPQCGHVVQVRYQVTLLEVVDLLKKVNRPEPIQSTSQSEVHPNNWMATTLRPKEIAFVEECQSNGLLAAFTQVVRDQTNVLNRPPTQMGKFLITFLRTAVVVPKLPPPILHEFIREFPGRIQFWKAQGIGMVLSEGRICRFVPMRSMNVGRQATTRGHRLEVNGMGVHRVESFDYISRTRHGYVPEGARIFLESLRHAMGDRGREMQDVPLRSSSKK